ncbi:UDP-Glycosyltransferase/glycogen phosphorylase [Hortaea werneckii]|nr:UDP-Glycosyltransferase/glycogen phosphorylase [Hortaea werneckii]KAI7485534.1 UDP-Glycosyltransferase/glycogen phosphorylase [Hortaea werneckii]
MALLFTLLVLLLSTAITLSLAPYLFRFIGRASGAQLRSRTQQRRELLRNRAAAEEKEEEAQRKAATPTPPSPAKTRKSFTSLDDDDWEKVTPKDVSDTTPPHDPSATTDSKAKDASFDGIIGFFHPFCNAGGGGERVLFAAIEATQLRYPQALIIVYTGDHDASKSQILTNVRNRFNIHLRPARIHFLYLSTRDWVLASRYPRFTLLGQSLGSLVLGWDALGMLVPDIFIDTMGYAFTLGLCKWLFPTSVATGAYVHYPTISTDMLRSLHSEVESNQGLHAGLGKGILGKGKEIYWELFAKLYSLVGGSIDVVMTNSTWTQRHMQSLWRHARTATGKPHPIEVVYPPCAVGELHDRIPVTLEGETTQRTNNILYIAQFRPEKCHTVILDAFTAFLQTHPHLSPPPKLILIGSVRDDQDEKRVYKLRLQAQPVKDRVDFVVNAQWPQILEALRTSSVGVNGMWNEHFGIGVVEYQAAGLISVVNDSGGPKVDIVVPDAKEGKPTGFHASTAQDFAAGFAQALSLGPEEKFAMRVRARESSWRFSERVFSEAWVKQVEGMVSVLK